MEYDSSFYFDNSILDRLCYNKCKLIQLAFVLYGYGASFLAQNEKRTGGFKMVKMRLEKETA